MKLNDIILKRDFGDQRVEKFIAAVFNVVITVQNLILLFSNRHDYDT